MFGSNKIESRCFHSQAVDIRQKYKNSKDIQDDFVPVGMCCESLPHIIERKNSFFIGIQGHLEFSNEMYIFSGLVDAVISTNEYKAFK